MANLLHISPTAELTARRVADFIAEQANAKEGIYSVALSGGSTPRLLFAELADNYRDKVAWSSLQLFWVDERCVPHTDPESNYGLAHETLLRRVPMLSEQIHPIECGSMPEEAARRYGQEIRDHVTADEDGWPQFDLVLLGMGEDGHTASLFPDRANDLLTTALTQVVSHPQTGQQRITLTMPVINRALAVAFMVTGGNKAERVADILHSRAGHLQYPAAHVRPLSQQLHWFLDEAAADAWHDWV